MPCFSPFRACVYLSDRRVAAAVVRDTGGLGRWRTIVRARRLVFRNEDLLKQLAAPFSSNDVAAATATDAAEDLVNLGRGKTLGQQIDSHIRALEKQIEN